MDKIKVLLAEDEVSLAHIVRESLEERNFTVILCTNGEQAYEQYNKHKPDILALDIMMPKIDGFDVLDILRNTPDTQGVKIIILSALSQPSDIERAKKLGADEYLVKSQNVVSDVMERIRFHLGLPPRSEQAN